MYSPRKTSGRLGAHREPTSCSSCQDPLGIRQRPRRGGQGLQLNLETDQLGATRRLLFSPGQSEKIARRVVGRVFGDRPEKRLTAREAAEAGLDRQRLGNPGKARPGAW